MVDYKKIWKAIEEKLDSMTEEEKVAYLLKMGFVLEPKRKNMARSRTKNRTVKVNRIPAHRIRTAKRQG